MPPWSRAPHRQRKSPRKRSNYWPDLAGPWHLARRRVTYDIAMHVVAQGVAPGATAHPRLRSLAHARLRGHGVHLDLEEEQPQVKRQKARQATTSSSDMSGPIPQAISQHCTRSSAPSDLADRATELPAVPPMLGGEETVVKPEQGRQIPWDAQSEAAVARHPQGGASKQGPNEPHPLSQPGG